MDETTEGIHLQRQAHDRSGAVQDLRHQQRADPGAHPQGLDGGESCNPAAGGMEKCRPNCDAWGNDCFRCPLSDCNDYRSARAGEISYVPEMEGREGDCDERVYRARISNKRYVK